LREAEDFLGTPGPSEWQGSKLPSALSVGGVPVATDGELVYLGGGLYAAAADAVPVEKPPPKRQQRPRQKVLPGRVSQPFRSLGPRSALRSASAHLVGAQTGAGEAEKVPLSPTPSRARSEGNLGVGKHHGGGLGSVSGGKEGGGAGSGPPVWRPSGPAKLPPAPDPQPRRAASRAESEDGNNSPGHLHSAARAEARENARRNGHGLFGGHGLLAQLRAGEAAAAAALEAAAVGAAPSWEVGSSSSRGPLAARGGGGGGGIGSASGPPLCGELRAAERRKLKDERNKMLIEERALRMAEQADKAAKKKAKALAPIPPRSMSNSFSAPDLGATGDLTKQKLRLACKMEILNFFKGYSSSVNNMTAQQTTELLAKLNSAGAGGFAAASFIDQEQGEDFQEQGEQSFSVDAEPSIQERLEHLNATCNRAFLQEEVDLDNVDDLDL